MSDGQYQDGGSQGNENVSSGSSSPPPPPTFNPDPPIPDPAITGDIYTRDLTLTVWGWTVGKDPRVDLVRQYLLENGYLVDAATAQVASPNLIDIQCPTGSPQITAPLWAAYNGTASVTQYSPVVIGDQASSTLNKAATSVGQEAHADGDRSTSYGRNSWAFGQSTTAIGDTAIAYQLNSLALGASATAGIFADNTKTAQVALGAFAQALGHNAVAVGTNATVSAAATAGLALGRNSTAGLTNAVAVGTGASVVGLAVDGVAVGTSSSSTGLRGVALGKSSLAAGSDSISVGTSSTASGVNTIVMGSGARAQSTSSMAFGNNAQVYTGSSWSIAFGDSVEIPLNTPYKTMWGAGDFEVMIPLAFSGGVTPPADTTLTLHSPDSTAGKIAVTNDDRITVNGFSQGIQYIKNGTTVVVTNPNRLSTGSGLIAAVNGSIPSEGVISVDFGIAAGTVAQGNDARFGTFAFAKNTAGTVVVTNPNRVATGLGLLGTQDGSISTQFNITADFGTGTNQIARGDHIHTDAMMVNDDILAFGTTTSTTGVTLKTYTLSGLDAAKNYMIRARADVPARNSGTNGDFQYGIRIGGSASYPEVKSPVYRTVGGVPVAFSVSTARPVTGGTSVNVVVRAFHITGSAAATEFMAGYLTVDAWPNR